MKRNIKPQICNLAQVSVLFLHRIPTMQCIPFLSSGPFIHLETIITLLHSWKCYFNILLLYIWKFPIPWIKTGIHCERPIFILFHRYVAVHDYNSYGGPPVSVDCTWLQRGGAAAGGGGTSTDYPPAAGHHLRHLRHLRPVPRTPGTRTQPHTAVNRDILSRHRVHWWYSQYSEHLLLVESVTKYCHKSRNS